MFENIISLFLSFIINLDLSHCLYLIRNNKHDANNIQSINHCGIINLFLLYYYVTGSLYYWNMLKIYSLGFLMADCVYFHLYHKISHWKIFLGHHLLFILSWILIEYQTPEIYPYFIRMLLSELSGLTLNMRNLAKTYQMKNLEFYLSIITYILFFVFRICNFTNMISICYKLELNTCLMVLFPLTGMQYFWFHLMNKKIWDYMYSKKIHMN